MIWKKTLSMLINIFNYSTYRSFYIALGRGEINSNLIINTLSPKSSKADMVGRKIKNKLPIIGVTKGHAVNFAECCNPLPGENIVGILTEKKGINVHLINCSVLERFTNYPELWYELTWDKKLGNYLQTARISLTVQNKVGSFNKITNCISTNNFGFINLSETDVDLIQVSYSNIEGGHSGAGIGNIDSIPHFINPDLENTLPKMPARPVGDNLREPELLYAIQKDCKRETNERIRGGGIKKSKSKMN